jgi:hypothetical protein
MKTKNKFVQLIVEDDFSSLCLKACERKKIVMKKHRKNGNVIIAPKQLSGSLFVIIHEDQLTVLNRVKSMPFEYHPISMKQREVVEECA